MEGQGARGEQRVTTSVARKWAAALLVLLAMSLVASAPALAASQRGHVFDFSFGAPGKGEGQFFHPSGIAVNNRTGEVYVADTANNRVERFKPVLNGQKELVGEAFVGAFAVPSPKAVAVDNSTEASDPSAEDVYVVGSSTKEAKEPEAEEERFVYKFSAVGVPLAKLGTFKTTEKGSREKLEGIQGVAVDSLGALFVYEEAGTILKFSDAAVNEAESSMSSALGAGSGRPGFALDSKGNFYAGVVGADAAAASEDPPFSGLVDEAIREFEGQTGGTLALIAKLEGLSGHLLAPALDAEEATAVAVNPQSEPGNLVNELNDAYVLNSGTSSTGEQTSTVAAFGEDGSLIQRFSGPGLKEGDGIAVDANSGAVYVADAASNAVDVFALEPRGRPTVEALSVCTLNLSRESGCPEGPNATTLRARVDPDGAATTYHFEFGAASCAGVPSSCTQTTATAAGEGFGEQGASVELQSLAPGTYHYRVVAENAFGTVRSPEQTFTILAPAGGLLDGRAWEMVSPPNKDGAEAEPMPKEGGVIQAAEDGEAIAYLADGPMPADFEPEGSRSPELTQILSTHGPHGGWTSQDINTPNTKGSGIEVGRPPEYQLFSTSLSLALLDPGGTNAGTLAQPPLSPPLEGEAGKQERTIYLRDDAPVQPEASETVSYEAAKENGESLHNAGFLPLVTRMNVPGGVEFGGNTESEEGLEVAGASSDLSHVVAALRKGSKQQPTGSSGLYEWEAGASAKSTRESEPAPKPVSVLPDKTLVGTKLASLGGSEGRNVRHAISSDGSIVFWGQKVGGAKHLYMRDTETAETLQLDVPQQSASGAGAQEAQFQTASADGTRVFFTDTQRLTPASKAIEGAPDLYVFERGAGSGPLSGALTDLTPQAGAAVLAAPQGGGVLGASEDGSYVYFVADGALAPGASRGHCPRSRSLRPAGTTCNLYVRHYNGMEWAPTKLIAALSVEDSPDWGIAGGKEGDLAFMTSRVSPNGRYLAFMSDRSLTGYDNEDLTSKITGERLDEEVFEYDVQTGGLVCASCNPTGERPAGVLDTVTSGGEEGLGLLVDRLGIWAVQNKIETDHWLAGSVPGWTEEQDEVVAFYQSRYLSDEGRLFFDSPDRLVPAATGQKEKVYEYEPGGVGSCGGEGACVGLISSGSSTRESAFLDASASGNDVFFLTAAPLATQDVDTNFDVYDARVCGSTCPEPGGGSSHSCEGEECQSIEPVSPLAGPASTRSTGSGNLVQQVQGQVLSHQETAKPTTKPLTRAQKLAKALKACRRDKNKHKRAVCEAHAKKLYGPVKHTTAKKSSAKGAR